MTVPSPFRAETDPNIPIGIILYEISNRNNERVPRYGDKVLDDKQPVEVSSWKQVINVWEEAFGEIRINNDLKGCLLPKYID